MSILAVGVSLVGSACAGGSGAGVGADSDAITVSAASSLREAFDELGTALEEAEGVEVTFNYDSSAALATQAIEGAPADVYASAAPEDMARLRDAGLVASPEVFAANALTIVTAPGNPGGVVSLADLADVGVVSLCGTGVPCGRYAQELLDAADVTIPEDRVTRGQNVAATLTAVAEGDAVAGIVYVTDARSAGEAVATVDIVGADEVVPEYSIAVLEATSRSDAAHAFVDRALSDEGQAVLGAHGFLPAP